MKSACRCIVATLLAVAAGPAFAGPPYQTDDPGTTDLHHWEIYNFVDLDGRRGDIDGVAGFDLSYGAGKDLQLTVTLPAAFSHVPGAGWHAGRGDLELAVKYRFVDDDRSGWHAAVFPRVILPTAADRLGGTRTRLLLPLWVQKDLGRTSIFGGAGYELNPGAGNRDFWQAAIAITHDFSDKLQLGTEVSWQAADSSDAHSTTGVDAGLIHKLGGPFSLLMAAGPTFSGGNTGYHGYAALGLNF